MVDFLHVKVAVGVKGVEQNPLEQTFGQSSLGKALPAETAAGIFPGDGGEFWRRDSERGG